MRPGEVPRRFVNIKFNQDETKIGAVFEIVNGIGFGILLLDTSNGALIRAAFNSYYNNNETQLLLPRSLLVDHDGSILMTVFDNWKMGMLKLDPPPASPPWNTKFLVK